MGKPWSSQCDFGADGIVRMGEARIISQAFYAPLKQGTHFIIFKELFMKKETRLLVHMGMLTGLSLLLVYFIHFPVFPSASFLEYDMADVPILIGTFLYGPLCGLLLTGAVSVLQWLLISPQSGFIGCLMHFIATGSFVLAAGYIYKALHTRKGAFLGLFAGALSMVLMMIPLNLVFTVHFMGVPRQAVVNMLLPIIIPFNAIKAGANGIITLIMYKTMARVLRLEHFERTLVKE